MAAPTLRELSLRHPAEGVFMKRTILFSLASLGIASLAHADQHTQMTDLLRIYEAEAPTGDTRGFIAEA